jgi:uncharacterized damage-inducible protein DinB
MGDAQKDLRADLPSLPTPAQLAEDLAYAHFLLWETLAELEAEEIENIKLASGWTAKMLVAHVAFWDEYQLRRMQAAVAGVSAAEGFARPPVDNDARSLDDAARPWGEVEQAAKVAGQAMVDFARSLSADVLVQEYAEGNNRFSVLKQLQHMVNHVLSHRREIQAYCGSLDRWGRAGLRRLMIEQHNNFMNSIAGLTETTLLATQVCGVWSIRDVLAHVLSWNEYCAKLLKQWPEPTPETISEWTARERETMTMLNDRYMAARAHLTMIEIADGLTTEHRRIMRSFDRASDTDLVSEGLTWGGSGVMSNFFYEISVHEAEHAAQIWAFRAGVLEEEAAFNRSDDS